MNEDSVLGPDGSEARQFDRLPHRRPDRVWGGRGSGADCAVCGKPIQRDQVEFELAFDGARQAGETYLVHSPCFAAWESLRSSLDAGEAAGRGDARPAGGLTGSLHEGNMSRRDRAVEPRSESA